MSRGDGALQRATSRLAAGWDRFWFAPEQARTLALYRIIFYLGVYWVLFIKGHFVDEILAFTSLPEPFHFPQGLHRFLPVPDPATTQVLGYFLRAALLLVAAGLLTRPMAVLAFLLCFYLEMQTMYGKIMFVRAIPVVSLGIMMLGRTGDALSVDSLIRRRWQWWPFGRTGGASGDYHWPSQLIRVYACLIFFTAGVAKLHASGLDWITSDHMASLLSANMMNQGCIGAWPEHPELNMWLVGHPTLVHILAGAVIAGELLAPLALIPGVTRLVMVTGFLAMNLGFRIFLGPQFNELILLYGCFFIPWVPIGRFVATRLARFRRDRR